MLQAHDPMHFERVLRARIAAPLTLSALFPTEPLSA
jgi:hypothetical protein